MLEESKVLAQPPWQSVSQHNRDALEEVYTTDSDWHEPDQDAQGVEDAKEHYPQHLSTFPDLSFTVEDFKAEEDEVVTRWAARGMKREAVYLLAALALCAVAVTLVLLLAPDISWVAVLKWLTPSSSAPPCPLLRDLS